MAESVAHDVVKEAQSVGAHHQPSDDLANTSNELSAGNGQATTTTTATATTASSELSPYDADGSNQDDDGHAVAAAAAAAAAGSAADESVVVVTDAADAGDGLLSKGGLVATSSLVDSVAQALADASGGSDTDTSRADPGKDDGKGHARTGSLKKPASFKPVSVTKSFLAKSLSASPVPRVGDKGVPNSPSPTSALQSAKPRLVAKSALGGGTRGIAKLNGTAGPDASKVWNKNRPAAPPAPRQFTDEELQTRYGIHMTARLQSDEAGKDSKWADIDDDEDDWAPETVEWMDGTKSNVGAEPQPLPARPDDRSPTPSNREQPAEPVKPVLASMHKPTVSQTTKTILRPGAQLSLSPKPGSAQKTGADHSPSGGSKPSLPPSKSPWAVLPPVEKIAPINPPIQQGQRPFQRDPQGFDALPPAPSPAQEIAADDFSRNYGGERAPRELFNAQSGRYEPASDARRGSRHEHGYRQPAVLQRPSQGGMSNGPAEPSAAFQTSRSSAEGGGQWGRRRASSSLSAAGRRPSLALSQDHAQHPHSEVAVESPKAAFANLDRPGPWTRSGHPHMEPPVAEGAPPPPDEDPQQPAEDPIIKQQRMMKEKIELARQAKLKRMEEEAAEAAARQERLKLKMAQLANASPSPEVHDHAVKGASPQNPAVQPPKANAVSPPKPPVPTAEGEVAQYGMMKVHQPHPVKKNFVSEASLTAKSNQDSGGDYSHRYRGSASPNKVVARPTNQQPGDKAQQQQKGLPNAPNTAAAPLDKLGGSWTASPSPNDYNWGPNSMNARSSVSASVWGPPSLSNNEKSLGNGTFESKFSHPNFGNNSRFDNSRGGGLPAQGPPLHGPVGSGIKGAATPPLRQSQFAHTFHNLSADQHPQSSSSQAATAANQGEQQPTSQSPSVDDQAFVSAHLDSSLQQSIAQTSSLHPQTTSQPSYSAGSSSNMSAQVSLPPTAPIGTSTSGMHESRKGALGSQDRARDWHLGGGRATQKSWQNFGADEQRKRDVEVAKYQREMATSKPQPKSGGVVTYDVYREGSTINTVEVFHVAIQPDGQKTTRRGGTFPLNANNAAKIKESEAQHPEDHLNKQDGLANGVTQSSSRFFPKGASGATSTSSHGAAGTPQIAVTHDETPPPAEQDLFDHDASQPVKVKFPIIAKVNLPGMKPTTSVSLPPRSPGLDKSFSGHAAGPSAGQHGHRAFPHTMRVDDLKAKFGHAHPGGVFANTKPAFDVTVANARPNGYLQNQQPRVAPNSGFKNTVFVANYNSSPQSQPLAEDACFDFPDFGSKPTVRVPKVPHQNHQFGYQHEGAMAAPLPRHMKYQVLDTQTVSETQLFPTEKGDKFGSKVAIKLTGMKAPKFVDARIPRRGGRSDGPPRESGSSGFRGGRGGSSRGGAFEGSSRRGTSSHSSRGGSKNEGTGRGGRKSEGYTGASNSSSSSPKPRGGAHWGPRNSRGGSST